MATESSGGESAPTDVVLIAPVRHQMVGLAAEILGRLDAADVPAPLRPIARFAPTKRARLGAAALASAIDADPDFRAHLATAVLESSPTLAAAVRDGTSTAACEPIDVAVVAYLTRPPGWVDVVDAASARWRAEQASTGGADGELDRLRGEVGQLRAKARAEAARSQAAVESATRDVQVELLALRRSARDRTRDLRRAEQERNDAIAAGRAGVLELQRQLADRDEELRRLRARLAALDQDVEAVRRATRLQRDIDDARLWLLVDTLVQAAAGVRRELSLPNPAVRPADAFASAAGSSAGRAVDDVPGLDAVLALPHVHLVVDGYNVTKTGYGELALSEQRGRLIGSLAPLAAQSGAEVTVVFDGAARPPVQPTAPRGVRVLFSAAEEIADDLIRRLVAAEPSGRPVVVVTSDRQIVLDTARGGVWAVPSAVLLRRLS